MMFRYSEYLTPIIQYIHKYMQYSFNVKCININWYINYMILLIKKKKDINVIFHTVMHVCIMCLNDYE